MADGITIGIDLGTTNTCAAADINGEIVIILDDGENVTPSYVAFDDKFIIGKAAKHASKIEPKNTVYAAKRLMGQSYAEVEPLLKFLPYEVVNKDSMPIISVTYKNEIREYKPEQIGAIILQSVKRRAENQLGVKVTGAVIAVPAHFSDSQRRATLEAGRLAGLKNLRLINEPTSAAIAYKHEKHRQTVIITKNVLVYDLGGGTFDASVMEIDGNRYSVKSVMGLDNVGGEDFDNRLVNYLVEEFQKKHNNDPRGDPRMMKRLRTLCEEIKKHLSVANTYSDEIMDFLGDVDINVEVTREIFETLNEDLFLKTIETVKSILEEVALKPTDIDEVILVGGSSRIPKIQQLLAVLFGESRIRKNLHPEEAVARGAAILAASKPGRKDFNVEAFDVVPVSLGVDDDLGRMHVIIPKNTPVPVERSKCFYNSVDNQPYLDVGIFAGENKMAGDNRLLANVTIEDLPPGRRFTVVFDYTFSVDVNGILAVSVVEKSTMLKKEFKLQYMNG